MDIIVPIEKIKQLVFGGVATQSTVVFNFVCPFDGVNIKVGNSNAYFKIIDRVDISYIIFTASIMVHNGKIVKNRYGMGFNSICVTFDDISDGCRFKLLQ